MGWTNVDEKLPPNSGEYLIYTNVKSPHTGGYTELTIQGRFDTKSGWHSLISEERPTVTHWMFLPDKPKK